MSVLWVIGREADLDLPALPLAAFDFFSQDPLSSCSRQMLKLHLSNLHSRFCKWKVIPYFEGSFEKIPSTSVL